MSRKPNGVEQVRQYAKLVNSDQRAPASAAWPDQLAGFRIGDEVVIQVGTSCHALRGVVTGLVPPGTLQVRHPSGREVYVSVHLARKVSP